MSSVRDQVAIEEFQAVLGPGFKNKINRVHPNGVLLIGSTTGLSQRQKDSFNHFRQGLFSLTIIIFDELLKRLKLMYCSDSDNDDVPLPRSRLTQSLTIYLSRYLVRVADANIVATCGRPVRVHTITRTQYLSASRGPGSPPPCRA
jgi:hypothetical protein